MKKIITFVLTVAFVIAVFSISSFLKNIHYINSNEFEQKTSEYGFFPSKNDLVENCDLKGRIINKGILFKRTYYELFVSFDSEDDFLAQQQIINKTYSYQDVNVKGVFGGLEDHVVCEKDGFKYRIADIDFADIDSFWGYPKQFLLIGSSQAKKKFVFAFIDDPDAGSVDDWNDYLKKELYI